MEENITDGVVFKPRRDYSHKPNVNTNYDLIIVGLGVSALAGAMYAARLGLKVMIIGEHPGGTLAMSGRVENYPGFVSIEGQKLTEFLENHAMDYDVDMDIEIVDSIICQDGFRVISGSKTYKSKAVLLATGARLKKLKVKGEDEFFGKGVAYCALCDAAGIAGKRVAIVGGGDGAVKEAILITEHAQKVYIINNEAELHPEAHNQRLLDEKISSGAIEVINSNEVEEICGTQRVESLRLKHDFQAKKSIEVSGVFVYIGNIPNSDLAKQSGVTLNSRNEVIINSRCETNIKGFFASGDVTNSDWKQAITAVAQGVTAGYYAYQYVRGGK